jgi:alanine racemase
LRARAILSSTALLNNFRVIAKKAGDQLLLPMVKADAYGHDASWVTSVLWKNASVQKKLFAFGVATFREALSIRQSLPSSANVLPIVVFSDCAPFSADWIKSCERNRFEPVFSDVRSFLEFQKAQTAKPQSKRLPFHIEVNTGMNRLGIPVESLGLVKLNPRSVFTHLAESESPNSELTLGQMRLFDQVISWKNEASPESSIHFANSGAIWNANVFSAFSRMDLVRPGLSLYGIRPDRKSRNDGLQPVMGFQAPVIQKTFLVKGDRVGYGGTYRSASTKGEWVATLGAGYADGVFRAMANQEKIVGKVSMDLITVKASAKTRIGDWITLWGSGIDPYEVADRAGTIPYEITTRIGGRVDRVYE